MIPNFVVAMENIDSIIESMSRDFSADQINANLSRAVNKAANSARKLGTDEMLRQVNFPGGYLTPSSGRLRVSRPSTPSTLEAEVRGRFQPTSLARFVTSSRKGRPLRVQVKAGGMSTEIPRAFLMRLRNDNTGLAVRTDGGPPKGAYKPRKISDNLWLLYGPSVDQVFRSVRADIAPAVQTQLTDEFLRLMEARI